MIEASLQTAHSKCTTGRFRNGNDRRHRQGAGHIRSRDEIAGANWINLQRFSKMTQRPWFITYREYNIPTEINTNAYRSTTHMLEQAMVTHADRPAFRSFGQTLTYADVDRQSRSFAAYLQERLGVRKGDRIAVMMPNLLAFPIAFLGIIRAGGVQVNVNPLYTPRELEHQRQGRARSR